MKASAIILMTAPLMASFAFAQQPVNHSNDNPPQIIKHSPSQTPSPSLSASSNQSFLKKYAHLDNDTSASWISGSSPKGIFKLMYTSTD